MFFNCDIKNLIMMQKVLGLLAQSNWTCGQCNSVNKSVKIVQITISYVIKPCISVWPNDLIITATDWCEKTQLNSEKNTSSSEYRTRVYWLHSVYIPPNPKQHATLNRKKCKNQFSRFDKIFKTYLKLMRSKLHKRLAQQNSRKTCTSTQKINMQVTG